MRKIHRIFGGVAAMCAVIVISSSVFAGQKINYSPVDIGPELRQWDAQTSYIDPLINFADEAQAAAEAEEADPEDCILDAKYFLGYDGYYGQYFFTTFFLMADGADAQIWVQANLSWPADDPREMPVVTCDQAEYMLSEFENNILPEERQYFGEADSHTGENSLLVAWGYFPAGYYEDSAGRQVILVSNVRDENYYDSDYPLYIAGFFSPALEQYFDRNTMTIDAYDWEERTGPDGARPYLYEGVFAHEYQHLLHSDYDADEELFVNEGLSDLAQTITGYGIPWGHVEDAMEKTENSLVLWEDQGPMEILADYGLAYLFQLYLLEQYGDTLIQSEFHNPENGILGIDDTLWDFGADRDFEAVYHDWAVALLIDSYKPGKGIYQFNTLDIHVDMGTIEEPNEETFGTPGAPPWGTDYIRIQGDIQDVKQLVFDGVDTNSFQTPWTSDGESLWGGAGDLVDNWAIFEATGGGMLTFDTQYAIEDGWDYGFIQVSTDGGFTWNSLANEYTDSYHDPSAISTVVDNLPGLTGVQSEWITMNFDLSDYPGDILIAFRYVTDWVYNEAGWFIDNVKVDTTDISDGTNVDPFMDYSEIFPNDNDFTVTVVGSFTTDKGELKYKVFTMKLDRETEEGWADLSDRLEECEEAVMMVTFDAPDGYSEYADYTYSTSDEEYIDD